MHYMLTLARYRSLQIETHGNSLFKYTTVSEIITADCGSVMFKKK